MVGVCEQVALTLILTQGHPHAAGDIRSGTWEPPRAGSGQNEGPWDRGKQYDSVYILTHSRALTLPGLLPGLSRSLASFPGSHAPQPPPRALTLPSFLPRLSRSLASFPGSHAPQPPSQALTLPSLLPRLSHSLASFPGSHAP